MVHFVIWNKDAVEGYRPVWPDKDGHEKIQDNFFFEDYKSNKLYPPEFYKFLNNILD